MFRKFGSTFVFLAAVQILALDYPNYTVNLTLDSGQSVCVKPPPDFKGNIEAWHEELVEEVERAKVQLVKLSTVIHQDGLSNTMGGYLQELASMFGAPPGTPITTAPPDGDDTPGLPFENPEGDSPRGDVASGEGVASQAAATPTSESKPKGRKKSPDASA